MPEANDKLVPASCPHDCGGRCFLNIHVKGGVISRLETDDGEKPQIRACLRGRAYRQRVYSADRVMFPMRRKGARGEGKFERISWDVALDTVASQLNRVKSAYGAGSLFFLYSEGARGYLHNSGTMRRLLNLFGGYTTRWGGQSAQGCSYACWATYGTLITDESRDGLIDSRLIIMWGWNPAVTIQTPNTTYHLARARESGARIVSVDPRFTETAAAFASASGGWIPIRPNTDVAMMLAMACVMIKEGLHNRRFLDKYTVGFDRFKDYVTGKEDGIPKTPAWAEAITGVPAATIESLAREYATSKPAALIPGWAAGRTAYGEQFHRAAMTLAAMTGNIGIRGGSAAGFGRPPLPFQKVSTYGFELPFPIGKNPLEEGAPSATHLDNALHDRYKVNTPKIWDALLKGKAGGYPDDFKLLYILCGNSLNQLLNTNKGVEALKSLEFVVVHEQVMTPTARFADILLPVNTHLERNDVFAPVSAGPYLFYSNQAVDSLGESKSDLEIASELAPRLGILNYNDKTEDEWLRELVEWGDFAEHIDDYDRFRNRGIWKWPLAEPALAFKEQIEDPEHHPFPTPSGKIEIYSQRLADLNNPGIPPIPKYIEAWENRNDPLSRKYPLQLITTHSLVRAHSTFYGVPWLQELEPQVVQISSADAQARGIGDGDEVRVFNDRGEMRIPARITERILPGVVGINQGAWYRPDENGIDRGGCVNILTRDERSPGGAFITNTCLVQVEKVKNR
ncbi:MAG: molybdopterin-dependent oxidoreductase [Chloroflexi bacterium]|nr:molybdopterin-dependent oxidoreductase [Chloroflexota bacterium]